MYKFLILACATLLFVSCKSPEARRPESISSGSFIQESVERNKELYAKEQMSIESIMKQNSEHEYMASQSGFWYFYNTKLADSIASPHFGDIVNFNYNVKSLNGALIYSKADLKTQNYAMDKQEIFTGLREGLKLMKIGETVKFIIPSFNAYNVVGDENKIGVNTSIISTVTLINIK